jgi:hypothetical protein
VAVPLYQLTKAFRLFDRIEVLTLHIFDQRDLGGGRIVDLTDKGGDGMKPRTLSSAPAPFAGNNLEPVTVRPQQYRLENAAFRNGIGQLVDCLFLELDARLLGIRPNSADFDFTNTASRCRCFLGGRRGGEHLLAQKRLKASA